MLERVMKEKMSDETFRRALLLIQMEYVEMSELRLTLGQAARLWALPIEICKAALETLVIAGFLTRTAGCFYARRGTPPVHVAALDALTWFVTPQSNVA